MRSRIIPILLSRIVPVFTAIVLLFAFLLTGCTPASDPFDDWDDDDDDDVTVVTEGDVCTEMDVFVMPTKLDYGYGETFSPAGLMFAATYENGYDADLNLTADDLDGWAPTGPLDDTVEYVVLKYKGFEYNCPVSVSGKKLLGVQITSLPEKRAYNIGDKLDLSGLKLRTSYDYGTTENETGYVVKDGKGKVFKDGTVLDYAMPGLELTVSMTSGGVTKSDSFTIDVFAGLTLQAEKLAKGELPVDESYTLLKGGEIKTDGSFSGTGYVGGMKAGDILEFDIFSPKKLAEADVTLMAASAVDNGAGTADVVFNDVFELYVDGKKVGYDGDVILHGKRFTEGGPLGKYTDWSGVRLGFIDINKGYTKISLRCLGGNGSVNIDRLYIQTYALADFEITRLPDSVEYICGSEFSMQGMIAEVVYDMGGYLGDGIPIGDGFVIKDSNGKVYEEGTPVTELGKKMLTASYEYRGVYKSDVFFINVVDGVHLAATAVAASGEEPSDRSYTKLSGGYTLNTEMNCLDSISKGATMEFHIYSEKAYDGADLIVTAASTAEENGAMRQMQFNGMFGVKNGGNEYFVGDGVKIEGKAADDQADRAHMWVSTVIGKIDLVPGFNVVTLECIGDFDGFTANIRGIDVKPGGTLDVRDKTLENIEIVAEPNYTYYGAGAKFDVSGLKVRAVYSDATVEDALNYTVKDGAGKHYADGTPLGTARADIPLTVEIASNGVVKSDTFTVHVNTSKITVEFEAFVDGDDTPANTSYTKRSSSAIQLDKAANASGGYGICQMKPGFWVDIYVYSEVAVKGATFNMTASTNDRHSNGTYDMDFNALYKLWVEDVRVDTSGAILKGRDKTANDPNTYFCWTDNEIGKVDLKAGFTRIRLDIFAEVPPQNGGTPVCCNLDKVDIYA
ncbi:MAG: hypothetical protein OSJ83_03660 [Clostridia bacterium]|nr:hypothetical protein [Clostridia bacterium]